MSRETLYEIACEMLRVTNINKKDIADIKYTNSQQEIVSLLELVKTESSLAPRSLRGKTDKNLQLAYEAISSAMRTYLESYTATYSFKQRTQANFLNWLDAIYDKYDIQDKSAREPLTIKRTETDTGIALLKSLHSRQGATIQELEEQLKISDRAVQKDLVKLDPKLYERGKKAKKGDGPYTGFRLGGQPLTADISYKKTETPRRFYMRNTVHPIVLQENITELATLLKALCRQFFDSEDDKCRLIAIDIWYQMSEYAQKKIKYYFAFDNPDLSDFIAMLEDDCPDDHTCAYHTEKELLNIIETSMPIDDALSHLMKVPERTGIIKLKTGKPLRITQLSPKCTEDGDCAYEAIDTNGMPILFTKDQVEDIHLK